MLCAESLVRIRRALVRAGGSSTLRQLCRTGIPRGDVLEAAEKGWVRLDRKFSGRRGRPVVGVEIRQPSFAELPPSRSAMARPVSVRHRQFAMEAVFCVRRGLRWAGIPALVEAYVRVYGTRSRAGAYTSCGRLLRRPEIQRLCAELRQRAEIRCGE
jgi:hypothetical protein